MEYKNCSARNKKMCEEPCFSCGKCWGIKQCEGCSKSYNKSKCRYDFNTIKKNSIDKTKKEITSIGILAILVSITAIIAVAVSFENYIIFAFMNPELTITQLLIRSIKKYWYIYIVTFTEYFVLKSKIKNNR